MSSWFVYVMSETDRQGTPTGFVKIGSAANPMARASQLNTGNPRRLVVSRAFQFETKAMAREVEHLAHRLCLSKVAWTEWFDCAVEDAVSAIKTALMVHKDGQRARDFERFEDVYAGQT
jgi:hypothetical protein